MCLTEALSHYDDSYSAGAFDSGADPSAEMASTPFVQRTSNTGTTNVNTFVVLPYGPT